jgi:hypothetical protein
MTSTPSLSDRLAGIVGAAHVLTDPADIAPFVTDWRGRYRGAAQCVVRPGNTAEVAAVVKACVEAGMPIVPQGGNTSLCGAATPDGEGRAVVISPQPAEPDCVGRCPKQHDHRRSRLHAGRRAGSCARRRPAVSAGAGLGRQLPDRRQSVDQRRRRAGAALRQHPRTDTRP